MKALQFDVTTSRFIVAKTLGTLFGKRVFYQGPAKTIRLTDIPDPILPAPDWVKIQTICCGFCGSDLNLILLHDSPTASPFTSFPCVPGHEIVGRIIETGTGVDGFTPGDRVVVNPTLNCVTRGIDPVCRSCRAGRPGNCENFAEGDLPPGMFIGINSGINGGFRRSGRHDRTRRCGPANRIRQYARKGRSLSCYRGRRYRESGGAVPANPGA